MLPLLATSLLATTGFASDWYVDAVNGSNANDGTSPATAWRTISHAVTQLPAGGERILVAAGTYNAALGELFPIRPKPGHQIVGVAGETRPVISADSAPFSRLFRFESPAGAPLTFGPDTRLENLKLRRADSGVELVADSGDVSPTFVDLEVERMALYGISVLAQGGTSNPTIERSFIGTTSPTSNMVCVRCTGVSSPGILLQMRDCVLADTGNSGLSLRRNVDARIERCRIDSLVFSGISGGAEPNDSLRLELVDSAVVNNLFPLSFNCDRGSVALALTRCSLGGNGNAINATLQPGAGSFVFTIDSSVVLTNGSLMTSNSNVQPFVQRSFFSDGNFAGINGCISGDARVRDELGGDLRLLPGSPCIDSAWSDLPRGSRDVNGQPRDTDGDLDRVGHTDLGAYEFQPLELTSTGELSTPLQLGCWGPQGAPTTIYWARAPISTPSSSPFGTFRLDLGLARVFRSTTAGALTPTLVQRMIPSDPALVGHSFSFQSLVDSPASPTLRAFTNAVEVTIVP